MTGEEFLKSVVSAKPAGSAGHKPGLPAYVEALQAMSYVDAPWMAAALDETRYKKNFATNMAESENVDAVLHDYLNPVDTSPIPVHPASRLQDPLFYTLLRSHFIRTHELAERRKAGVNFTPLIGSIPSGELNARAVYLGLTQEYGVLFEDEVLMAAHLISKIVAEAFVEVDNSNSEMSEVQLSKATSPSPALVDKFSSLLLSYVRQGWVRATPRYQLPSPVQKVAEIFCYGFELFLMGHEYGHMSLGHLNGKMLTDFNGIKDLTVIERSQAQEHEADIFGLSVAADDSMEKWGSPVLGFVGAYLSMKTFEAVNRTLFLLAKGYDWNPMKSQVIAWQEQLGGHPSEYARCINMRTFMRQVARPYEGEINAYASAIDLLFDALFQKAMPTILALPDPKEDRGIHPRFRSIYVKYLNDAPGLRPFLL